MTYNHPDSSLDRGSVFRTLRSPMSTSAAVLVGSFMPTPVTSRTPPNPIAVPQTAGRLFTADCIPSAALKVASNGDHCVEDVACRRQERRDFFSNARARRSCRSAAQPQHGDTKEQEQQVASQLLITLRRHLGSRAQTSRRCGNLRDREIVLSDFAFGRGLGTRRAQSDDV
jgi:hypothetical protein